VRWVSGWFPVLLLTLLIFLLSSRPYTSYFGELEGPSYRLFQRYLQYPVHLMEYAALAFLWVRALLQYPAPRRRPAWIALGAVFLTALVDETIQHFIPTRSFALRDLFMDGVGGIMAVAASRKILPCSDAEG